MLTVEISSEGDEVFFGVFDKTDMNRSAVRRHLRCRLPSGELRSLSDIFPFISSRDFSSDREIFLELSSAGKLLWESVFPRPVREILLKCPRKTLLLLLDERLAGIPWEMAYDGGDFLCRRFACSRILRSKRAEACGRERTASSPARILIIADPAGKLPSAYREGLWIKDFLLRLSGFSVDFKSYPVGKLFLRAALSRYDILHFAGHCVRGGKDGWVLSDGVFGAEDIIQAGESAPLPSFVFANACFSALMTGAYPEGESSLITAFLFHGTRHYLGTLAAVEDTRSGDFAAEFYRRLAGGLSVGESVRLSRTALSSGRESVSCAWSRYLLYGQPGSILYDPRRAACGSRRRVAGRLKAAAAAIMTGAVFLFGPSIQEEQSNYILLLKGRRMFRSGKYALAAEVFKEVISRTPQCVAAYQFLGEIYERAGRRKEALECYYKLAEYCIRNGYKRGLSSAYTGIGWIHQLQGERGRSREFYNKSLALAKENGDRLNEAVVLRRMAVWQIDAGNYPAALELLTKSSELNRENQSVYRHRYNLACDYFDFGLVFVNKDDYPAAKRFYLKSLRLFERLGAAEEISDCYFNLGEVFFLEKDYRRASELYDKGLAMDVKYGNRANIAGDYNMIGELYLETGDNPAAERAFLLAEENAVEAGAVPELAEACRYLARICRSRQQKQKAREYLRRAQAIFRETDLPAYYNLREELREME